MKDKIRKILAAIYHYFLIQIAQLFQIYFLWRIKKKKIIRIIFIVSENQKWNCDSLYSLLDKDERFNVEIAVTKLERASEADHNYNLQFFRQQGYTVINAYDLENDRSISVHSLKADIFFPQQPGGLLPKQNLFSLMTAGLLCYVPYEQVVSKNDQNHYNLVFMKILWKYFAPNEIIKNLFLKTNRTSSRSTVVTTGHPKLDYYTEHKVSSAGVLAAKNRDMKVVIYAPHHALESSSLRYSSFLWTGDWMLDFAMKRPDTYFVFKPHPRLRYALYSGGFMEQIKVREYFDSWANLANGEVYDEGNYIGLFNSSNLLVTDYGSFLFEYFESNKPAIITKNIDNGGLNEFGESLLKHYKVVSTTSELNNNLNQLLVEENTHEMQHHRISDSELMTDGLACENIINHIVSDLNI